MVTGYKDKEGKFHPIGQKGVTRKSRNKIRYANGVGSAQEASEQAKDFSAKIRDRYNKFKAEQDEEFRREIELRRKFGGQLIDVYRLAVKQQVKSGRDLEKFIRSRIPNLPTDKKNKKFIVNILRDFKKAQERLENKKKGKSEEEQKKLDKDFEDSLNESKLLFIKQQTELDKKHTEETRKDKQKFEGELKKAEKEAKEAREAREKAERDEEEAKKTQADPNASEGEKERAEQKAEESEKKAQKEEKEATNVGDEIAEELKKAQQEGEQNLQEDLEMGFPSGII